MVESSIMDTIIDFDVAKLQIIENAQWIRNKAILLTHFSSRYHIEVKLILMKFILCCILMNHDDKSLTCISSLHDCGLRTGFIVCTRYQACPRSILYACLID